MYKPTYHTLSKRGYITLLALLVSIITFAQGVTVKGTILDENKEPLIGATVQVKGETTGRNDLCPCGSGKKYKNCCGQDK